MADKVPTALDTTPDSVVLVDPLARTHGCWWSVPVTGPESRSYRVYACPGAPRHVVRDALMREFGGCPEWKGWRIGEPQRVPPVPVV